MEKTIKTIDIIEKTLNYTKYSDGVKICMLFSDRCFESCACGTCEVLEDYLHKCKANASNYWMN